MEGYKDQDARLNGMDRIVTDLYGTTRAFFSSVSGRGYVYDINDVTLKKKLFSTCNYRLARLDVGIASRGRRFHSWSGRGCETTLGQVISRLVALSLSRIYKVAFSLRRYIIISLSTATYRRSENAALLDIGYIGWWRFAASKMSRYRLKCSIHVRTQCPRGNVYEHSAYASVWSMTSFYHLSTV